MSLRRNIVWQLMEYLPPIVSYYIVMDNYLAYFCLRTQRGVNNIRETDVLNKNW